MNTQTASPPPPPPASPTVDDPRWALVRERSDTADGRFVYSVRTTGVYCRPSCASRTARPEHVAFHDDPAAAERAGFRACKRCKPNEPSRAEQQAALIARLCRRIESAEVAPSLDELAADAAVSRHHLHRLFKTVTGLTPRAWAQAHRAQRVRQALDHEASVTQAFHVAGYASSGRFYEESMEVLGMTPTQWRRGGAGTEIRFAVGDCSLGVVLVAQTGHGVCAILLGDEPEPLVRNLQDRFPQARLIGADAGFERVVALVVGLIESPAIGLDLPLDLRGTAFQQRVWLALRDIPAGATSSYTDIAQRIGAPTATRAVAQACGANPLAVAIPCHRVVRLDGGLSGYRWGVERKRALLEREAAAGDLV